MGIALVNYACLWETLDEESSCPNVAFVAIFLLVGLGTMSRPISHSKMHKRVVDLHGILQFARVSSLYYGSCDGMNEIVVAGCFPCSRKTKFFCFAVFRHCYVAPKLLMGGGVLKLGLIGSPLPQLGYCASFGFSRKMIHSIVR